MRSGGFAITTGIYRSQCSCRARQEIRRGDEGPSCPACGEATEWAFQKSTYRAPESAAPAWDLALTRLPAVE
jgi:hypothetical protein